VGGYFGGGGGGGGGLGGRGGGGGGGGGRGGRGGGVGFLTLLIFLDTAAQWHPVDWKYIKLVVRLSTPRLSFFSNAIPPKAEFIEVGGGCVVGRVRGRGGSGM